MDLSLPLCLAILGGHSFFIVPVIEQIFSHHSFPSSSTRHLFFLYQFLYLIFLFVFSLLSTGAIVFTLASLYTSKSVSAIPRIFKRLFITYLCVSLLFVIYNFVLFPIYILYILSETMIGFVLYLILIWVLEILFMVFLHKITSRWLLASVVSVVKPVRGLDAIKKSIELGLEEIKKSIELGLDPIKKSIELLNEKDAIKKSIELLNEKALVVQIFVLVYLLVCMLIEGEFMAFVVTSRNEGFGLMTRVIMGAVFVGVGAVSAVVGAVSVVLMVAVNLIGLLVQTGCFFVCKSEEIDRIIKVLDELLGGYLGQHVPLDRNFGGMNQSKMEFSDDTDTDTCLYVNESKMEFSD